MYVTHLMMHVFQGKAHEQYLTTVSMFFCCLVKTNFVNLRLEKEQQRLNA